MADDRQRLIVPCVEVEAWVGVVPVPADSEGVPPPTLRHVGEARIAGRVVMTWNSSLGSYGMGGPGFFGLHLAATANYPDEWLVRTLWGAAEWLLWDGRWVEAHPNQYRGQRPWYSNYGGADSWDELSPQLTAPASPTPASPTTRRS